MLDGVDRSRKYKVIPWPRCPVCSVAEYWKLGTLRLHQRACPKKEVIRPRSGPPGYEFCCDEVERVFSTTNPPGNFPMWSHLSAVEREELRKRANRTHSGSRIATDKQAVLIALSRLAYTLKTWGWRDASIGALLTGKGESAVKMAAARSIAKYSARVGLPIPWTPEFQAKLCEEHAKISRGKPPRGASKSLRRERSGEADASAFMPSQSSRQTRPTIKELMKLADSLSADRLRELEREYRDLARESDQIAKELARRASEKEADGLEG